MGYRSDVTAMFYDAERKLTYTQTMDWLRTNFPAVFEAWPAGHWAPLDDSKDVTPVVFKADYVKWYTKADFKDVDVFEDMLAWFESINPTTSDEACPIECEFGRIGEDTDDIEYRCSFNAQYRMQQVRAWDLT
jgi:hypothetical protein